MQKAFLCLLMIWAVSCRDHSTGPNTPLVQLSAENVGVYEANLRIQISTGLQHDAIVLTRNGTIFLSLKYRGTDTLLIDQQLIAKHTYTYKAYALADSVIRDSSDALTIMTMDRSSHNFQWELTTLGNVMSHGFYDVAIVSDTCAWAVGEIYIDDTLYNAARWDGSNWNLEKIPTITFYGDSGYDQLKTVFAFNDSDIWAFSIIGSYSHWNGLQWKSAYVPERSGGGLRFWGTSSSDLYLACTNGGISHYNGTQWQKLESGTTLNITDIYGAKNQKTGETEILAVATGEFSTDSKKFLKISSTTVTTLSDSGLLTCCMRAGVWFVPGEKYFVSGIYIYTKRDPASTFPWEEDLGSTVYFYNKNVIRGNGINDFAVITADGKVLHNDGVYWWDFPAAHLPYGTYNSVAIRGNLVVAVGENEQLGVIAVGKRN